jgi:hypothetical protein
VSRGDDVLLRSIAVSRSTGHDLGAGIYGATFPIIVADLTRGTGRFSVAQRAVITAHGIGAALSTTIAGLVVVHAGYHAAFLTLAGVAVAGLILFVVAMPETAQGDTRPERDTAGSASVLDGRPIRAPAE